MTNYSRRLLAAAIAAVALAAGSAVAQFGPGPGGRGPLDRQPAPRNEAGRFDYYSLVLSWSPTFCASQGARPNDPQCNPRGGRRYSFVMHGLWPQHERGWPESCPTRERTFVPDATINRMLEIMPSRNLVIHEYRKHGTCSGLSPEAYFDLSRRLFDKVRTPPRIERANQALVLTPDEIVRDFTAVNPALKAESIAVTCNGPGNRLREVRICFSREGEFRPCGRNEDARRLCNAQKVYIPPVREAGPGRSDSTERPSPGARPAVPPQGPLPGPETPSNSRGERRI